MLNTSSLRGIAFRVPLLLVLFFMNCADASLDLKKKIELYLNQLKTLEADFHQTDSVQKISKGHVYLSRPGKIRFDFLEPDPKLLVSDGSWLIFYDTPLQEVTYMDIKDTPGKFLLANEISFDKDTVLKEIRDLEEYYIVHLEALKEGYHLILHFLKNPLILKGWTIRDAQGNETHLMLFNHKENKSIDETQFQFKDPRPKRKKD